MTEMQCFSYRIYLWTFLCAECGKLVIEGGGGGDKHLKTIITLKTSANTIYIVLVIEFVNPFCKINLPKNFLCYCVLSKDMSLSIILKPIWLLDMYTTIKSHLNPLPFSSYNIIGKLCLNFVQMSSVLSLTQPWQEEG